MREGLKERAALYENVRSPAAYSEKNRVRADFAASSSSRRPWAAPITTSSCLNPGRALSTATKQPYTCVTMGPNGKLYASTENGDIFQFSINSDGTLGSPTDIRTIINKNGGARLITAGQSSQQAPDRSADPVAHG